MYRLCVRLSVGSRAERDRAAAGKLQRARPPILAWRADRQGIGGGRADRVADGFEGMMAAMRGGVHEAGGGEFDSGHRESVMTDDLLHRDD